MRTKFIYLFLTVFSWQGLVCEAKNDDTKSFLEDSLQTSNSTKLKANSTKLAHNLSKVKLMPFVPGRILPHKDDTLVAKDNVLKAEVSVDSYTPVVKHQNKWIIKKRVVNNSNSNALNKTCQKPCEEYIVNVSAIKSVAKDAVSKAVQFVDKNNANNQITKSDFENINLNDFTCNQNQESEFKNGPPPFPLNLIPAKSLKSFLNNGSNLAIQNTRPAFFGSWHQSSSLGCLSNSSKFYDNVRGSNLPPCGFHSNLNTLAYGTSQSGLPYGGFAKVYRNYPDHTRQHYSNVRISQAIKTSAKTANTVKIASYPPYKHSN